MNSYWSPLADVLPVEVTTAMDKACADATHRGTGRADEPILLAGVRALLNEVVLRRDHESLVTQMANYQRHEAELHRQELARRWAEARADIQADLSRLEAVRGLVYTTKKTVPTARLREALGIDEAPASPEVA
jgi:DNA-binding helix-hairpin-helix protein with protein kinase domain